MKQQHKIIGWSFLMLVLATTATAQKEERNFIRRGNRQYADSAFVNADVSYRKAIEANPSSAIAMYNLGNTLTQQNKLEDAMKMYVDASKLETDKERLGQIYHNMGVILHSQKEYAKAIEAYKQSLRNEPHSNETKYNLALAQKMLKDQQQQNQDQQQQNQKQDQQQQQNHTPRSGRGGYVIKNSTPKYFRKHVNQVFNAIKNKSNKKTNSKISSNSSKMRRCRKRMLNNCFAR